MMELLWLVAFLWLVAMLMPVGEGGGRLTTAARDAVIDGPLPVAAGGSLIVGRP